MAMTYLALLRGINVGGKNKLPMKELRDLFAATGCQDVRTYIQSRNVLFRASREMAATLPGAIQDGIQERFGLRVPVVLRTTERYRGGNPRESLSRRGCRQQALHVVFLADRPDDSRVAESIPTARRRTPSWCAARRLPPPAEWGSGDEADECILRRRELGTMSTGRNWRTVNTLFKKMQG